MSSGASRLAPVLAVVAVSWCTMSAPLSSQGEKLPDWGGVWTPNFTDQQKQVTSNLPPWRPEAAAEFARQAAEAKAGKPRPLFVNCLPLGMPSLMLITHNAMEVLFTPGRVTLLGEGDGNRLRRIYTDGRPLPPDPDPSFHGYSVGRWEGEVLVVETVGIVPQSLIAAGEALGIPNNGDLRVRERIHLLSADLLAVDLEIEAPMVLTAAWKTRRTFFRQRARRAEIVESVCLQGQFAEGTDAHGNAVFVAAPTSPDGTPLPASR